MEEIWTWSSRFVNYHEKIKEKPNEQQLINKRIDNIVNRIIVAK